MSVSISLNNVSQSFALNDSKVTLFEQLSISVQQEQSYAITGPSGAGKSSLLMLMAGLEQPTSGKATFIKGQQVLGLKDLRSEIGFVFQQFHLLPELTALNNVALPLKLRGDKAAISKAEAMLKKVGLLDRINHSPTALSGGEQQRVAIARALVFQPKFIFADEPTGNLDEKSAVGIADTLFNCCHETKAALVIVTHSELLAKRAQHVYRLSHGKLKIDNVHYPINKTSEINEGVLC